MGCVCAKCGLVVPDEEIGTSRRTGKATSVCNHCVRAQSAERNKRYRQVNKERINQRLKQRRAEKGQKQ